MTGSLRTALASSGPAEFSVLHDACVQAGHVPVAYLYCRSMRPRARCDPNAGEVVASILGALPPGMDLLLPGSAQGVADALAGYRPDLLVVYGFSWRLPDSVLRLPRLGAINVHTSMLPRYRGPAPVLWAIRNGDPDIGVTIHRMDENFDTGPILAQRGGVPLEDEVTPERLWPLLGPVIGDLLGVALDRVAAGSPGEPQDEAGASYAGFLEPEFSFVDWSHSARSIHDQVRTFHFMGPTRGPVAQVGDQWLTVLRTSTEPTATGIRVDCADGPLWITESAPARPPLARRAAPT